MTSEADRKVIRKAMAYGLLNILRQVPDKRSDTPEEPERLTDACIAAAQQ